MCRVDDSRLSHPAFCSLARAAYPLAWLNHVIDGHDIWTRKLPLHLTIIGRVSPSSIIHFTSAHRYDMDTILLYLAITSVGSMIFVLSISRPTNLGLAAIHDTVNYLWVFCAFGLFFRSLFV